MRYQYIIITRVLADLSDEEIKWLGHFAAEQGKSRASVFCEAASPFAETAT